MMKIYPTHIKVTKNIRNYSTLELIKLWKEEIQQMALSDPETIRRAEEERKLEAIGRGIAQATPQSYETKKEELKGPLGNLGDLAEKANTVLNEVYNILSGVKDGSKGFNVKSEIKLPDGRTGVLIEANIRLVDYDSSKPNDSW